MDFHVATFLSGLAYLALCLLAAGARFKMTQPEPKGHNVPGCLIILPAWLGIPFGTLPAFIPTGWSGVATLICLTASCSYDAGWRVLPVSRFQAPLRLGLALAACAWHARQRGVPGDLLSLDTYVAMPLAGVTEGAISMMGLALLGLGSLPLGGGVAADRQESLRHLAGLAVWICLFLPACPARDLGLAGLPGFAVDGLYFWVKILLMDYVLRVATLGAPQCLPAIQTGFVCAGVLLLC